MSAVFANIHTAYRGRRKTLPAREMAQLLREGTTVAELVEITGATKSAIQGALSIGGWGLSGEPVVDGALTPGTWALWRVPPWMEQARCLEVDPDEFFPEQGETSRDAVAVCRRCPVAAECLEHALDTNERFGVWGGLTERGRRQLKRKLNHGTDTEQEDQIHDDKAS